MDSVAFEPIGVVRSPFATPEDVPVNPNRPVESSGKVELKQDYADGLRLLAGFSHIIIISHLHLIDDTTLRTSPPFVEDVHPGIFATRGPNRPNPIGLSIVRLTGSTENTLEVSGLDLVDGTPVLDIKPYYPKPGETQDLRGGWIEENLDQRPVTATQQSQ
jgi:tRNA-Thr(GGU) m(6)t(6)A37 methyltransferase TsaA